MKQFPRSGLPLTVDHGPTRAPLAPPQAHPVLTPQGASGCPHIFNFLHHMNHYIQAPSTPLGHAKARNQSKECSARGCDERRHGLNAYCAQHNIAYRRYGHSAAHPIKAPNYTPYRKGVLSVFGANESHPGFVASLDYVRRWLQGAAADETSSKAAPELARLVREGVSPRDVLVEACAFWCYVKDNPRALPDTRSEDFALSRAVMALAPRPRRYTREAIQKGTTGYQMRPKFKSLDGIGAWLRSVLAFFLANVHEAVSTRDARSLATLQALRAPLTSPTADYLAQAALKSINQSSESSKS